MFYRISTAKHPNCYHRLGAAALLTNSDCYPPRAQHLRHPRTLACIIFSTLSGGLAQRRLEIAILSIKL